MKLLHEHMIGGTVIACLVAIGLLLADEHDFPSFFERPIFSEPAGSLSSVTVSRVDWSADGKTLLCQSRGGINATHSLTIHNLTDGTAFIPPWCDAFNGLISHASLTPDGTGVVLATFIGELWWIDLDTSAATKLADSDEMSFCVTAIGHDGQLMAGATDEGDVFLCDPTHNVTLRLTSEKPSRVTRLQFSDDSQRLLCARTDGSVTVWDTLSGKSLGEIPVRENTKMTAAFLPDGNHIACSSSDSSILIWEINNQAVQWTGPQGTFGQYGVVTMSVAATGHLAACGNLHNQRIVIWDLTSRQKRFEIENPSVILDIKFSPDGSLLAVAGRENVVRLYDMRTGNEVRTINVARTVDPGVRI